VVFKASLPDSKIAGASRTILESSLK